MEGGDLRPIDVVWISRLRYACGFTGIPLFEKDGFSCNPTREMPADLARVFRKGNVTVADSRPLEV